MTGPPFLTDAEIALFERWIEGGVPTGAAPTATASTPVAPRRPGPGEAVTYLHVAPIFATNCAKCHAERGIMGPAPEGYRLTSHEATVSAADRVHVVPGHPEASELVRRIRGQAQPRMPFDGPPYLSEADIALIVEWIRQGARIDKAPATGEYVEVRGRVGADGAIVREVVLREYLAMLALSAALVPSAANACESAGPATAIDAVRVKRAAFNEAIAKKDIEAVAATMHASIILLTGTASEVFTGRAAQVSLWQKDFENPRRAVYVRTTDCVREGQAEKSSTESFAAGVYAAKWRRVDGTWLLEAEVFATEACGGDFCPVDDENAP